MKMGSQHHCPWKAFTFVLGFVLGIDMAVLFEKLLVGIQSVLAI